MENKMLTVQDLLNFCKTNKMFSYNSKETGKQIIVQSIQDYSKSEVNEVDGKLFAKVRVCHLGINRNGSNCSEESMKEALPSLAYSPFLAYIHQLDNGEWDFESHNGHVEQDEDGNDVWIYDEKQVGTFTADEPYFEYDEEMDKTYVVAKVAIPTEYSKAAEIIKSKGYTKVSCELAIDEFSYNAKEGYLDLLKYSFMGVCGLGRRKDGTEVGEGMIGSKLTLEDFSAENNSLVKFCNQMEEVKSKLDTLLSHFDDIDGETQENLRKEEVNSMDETKVVEEVTDEMEVTEAEESNTEVTETVIENESEETVDETPEEEIKTEENEEIEVTEEVETEEEPVEEVKNYSIGIHVGENNFELSLDEKIYALAELVNITYSEVDNTYYGVTVYENHLVMHDYWNGRHYKQTYSSDEESFTLTGDRVEVYATYCTQEELDALDEMKSNYSELQKYHDDAEFAKAHSEKEAILNSEKYSSLNEVEEFAQLRKEMDNYSLADLEREAKVIFADNIESVNFNKTEKAISKIGFSMNEKSQKKKPYGTLFK